MCFVKLLCNSNTIVSITFKVSSDHGTDLKRFRYFVSHAGRIVYQFYIDLDGKDIEMLPHFKDLPAESFNKKTCCQ